MKTNLTVSIETAEEAKNYISALISNNEIYHLDDDAEDIIWNGVSVTREEINQLNVNRDKVFTLLEDPFFFVTLED